MVQNLPKTTRDARIVQIALLEFVDFASNVPMVRSRVLIEANVSLVLLDDQVLEDFARCVQMAGSQPHRAQNVYNVQKDKLGQKVSAIRAVEDKLQEKVQYFA
jgi:hypothetical protein